jgi:hypothetical protein
MIQKSVNWKLRGPFHFTAVSTSSSSVNMMIKIVKYWCLGSIVWLLGYGLDGLGFESQEV